jgi:putative SOS response-associated peptidase YedK
LSATNLPTTNAYRAFFINSAPVIHRKNTSVDWPRAKANARAEAAVDKPAFRDAFRYGRCLVPADRFFE